MKNIQTQKSKKCRRGEAKILSPELYEFLTSTETTEEIAARYGIAPSTLTMRAKRAGLPLRQQGRTPQRAPTFVQEQMIQLALERGYQYAASQFGLTKQRIHQIIKRWNRQERPQRKKALKKDGVGRTRGRLLKRHVISFRLDGVKMRQLYGELHNQSVKNPRSPSDAAREIVSAFLAAKYSATRNTSTSGM